MGGRARTKPVGKAFYSPAELTVKLGVSKATIYRLIHNGELAAKKIGERRLAVSVSDYEAYIAGTDYRRKDPRVYGKRWRK